MRHCEHRKSRRWARSYIVDPLCDSAIKIFKTRPGRSLCGSYQVRETLTLWYYNGITLTGSRRLEPTGDWQHLPVVYWAFLDDSPLCSSVLSGPPQDSLSYPILCMACVRNSRNLVSIQRLTTLQISTRSGPVLETTRRLVTSSLNQIRPECQWWNNAVVRGSVSSSSRLSEPSSYFLHPSTKQLQFRQLNAEVAEKKLI